MCFGCDYFNAVCACSVCVLLRGYAENMEKYLEMYVLWMTIPSLRELDCQDVLWMLDYNQHRWLFKLCHGAE